MKLSDATAAAAAREMSVIDIVMPKVLVTEVTEVSASNNLLTKEIITKVSATEVSLTKVIAKEVIAK